MDAEEQSGMGVPSDAGPEETVQAVSAYEYEVYLECDGKGKVEHDHMPSGT